MQVQLSVVLLLSVGAAVSLLFTVAVTQANAILHAQEGAADAELVTTIKGTMESALDAAELVLLAVAADPVLQELIARRDRPGLERHLAPVYDSLRGHVSRFHVHLPDSVSFLRLHARDEYGDNLSELRTMVAMANRELKTVRGLEAGVHGLSLRVVMPVLQAERHVGSVELGVDFGARLVAELLERRPAEYYLYRFRPDGAERLTIPAEGDPCPLEPAEMDRALEGEVFAYTTCSFRDRILVVPLTDMSGIPVAFLKVVSDRSALESALQLMRYRLSMLGMLLTLGLTGVVALLLGRLLRPLTHIVNQTREIANGIAEGNADVGGAVRGSASDFRDIVAEINRVIGALRASEHQKRAILDGFPGMLYYVDAELNVLWANETVLEMRPDMVGKNCRRDFTDNSFFSCEQCILLDAIVSGRIERGSSWFSEGSETGRSCWEYAAVPNGCVGGGSGRWSDDHCAARLVPSIMECHSGGTKSL